MGVLRPLPLPGCVRSQAAADQQLGDHEEGLAEGDGLQPQPQRHRMLGADQDLMAHPTDEESKAQCGEGIGGPAAC